MPFVLLRSPNNRGDPGLIKILVLFKYLSQFFQFCHSMLLTGTRFLQYLSMVLIPINT